MPIKTTTDRKEITMALAKTCACGSSFDIPHERGVVVECSACQEQVRETFLSPRLQPVAKAEELEQAYAEARGLDLER
ncbi:hypothetical protein AB0F17_65705 [Nonomuraea sp. NPDC026600]|uniref:hypothetical protein n=1 Tax=Nonomuraea sp. NPDC026600 TaxID=3155363 RepID=UPI0033D005CB